MRSLNVYIDRRPVGVLLEGDDIWRFEYDTQWVSAAHGFDLAPGLPRAQRLHVDGASIRPVQWYFDNMLPEELLRDAISKEAGIKGEDAFALLEYLGAESAGSLTLLPPGQSWHEKTTLRPLSDETLSRRIAGLPRRTLTADSPKRMSLAGAQHKLLVVYHDRQLYEPQGAAASTHILKPLHPETGSYPASVINEYVTMRIAGAIGLPVPAVHIRYAPNPLYIVERFDRQIREIAITGDGAPTLEVARLHIIDACQLLNRSRTFKHTGASLDSLRRVIECTTNKLHSRLQLFRWLVFNIVMANDDCHLKNLSFFMASDGIKLAPFYDLLATGAYSTRAFAHEQSAWPDLPMAIELPGARVFGQVTGECVRAAAHELGVPTNAAHRILKEVITRVPLALDQETFNLEERHAALPLAARAYLAAETRLIGVLQHIIVPEMLQRLS